MGRRFSKKPPAWQRKEEEQQRKRRTEDDKIDPELRAINDRIQQLKDQGEYVPVPQPRPRATGPAESTYDLNDVDRTEAEMRQRYPDMFSEGEHLTREDLAEWIKESLHQISFALDAVEQSLVEVLALELIALQQTIDVNRLRSSLNLNAIELLAAQPHQALVARRKACDAKGLAGTVKRLSARIKELHENEPFPDTSLVKHHNARFKQAFDELSKKAAYLWQPRVSYINRFRARNPILRTFLDARAELGTWNHETARLLRRTQIFWSFDSIHLDSHLSPYVKKKRNNQSKSKKTDMKQFTPDETELTGQLTILFAAPDALGASIIKHIESCLPPNLTLYEDPDEEGSRAREPIELKNPVGFFIGQLHVKLLMTNQTFNVLSALKDFGNEPVALLQLILCGKRRIFHIQDQFRKFSESLGTAYPDLFGKQRLLEVRAIREKYRRKPRPAKKKAA